MRYIDQIKFLCMFKYTPFSPADPHRGSISDRSQSDDNTCLLAVLQPCRRQLQVILHNNIAWDLPFFSKGAQNQAGPSADLIVPRRWREGGRLTYIRNLGNTVVPQHKPEPKLICSHIYTLSPEVLVPAQTDATFEIDEYFQVFMPPKVLHSSIHNKDWFQPCYLYECITPLRALMLQKTAPSKWKVRTLNPREADVMCPN